MDLSAFHLVRTKVGTLFLQMDFEPKLLQQIPKYNICICIYIEPKIDDPHKNVLETVSIYLGATIYRLSGNEAKPALGDGLMTKKHIMWICLQHSGRRVLQS